MNKYKIFIHSLGYETDECYFADSLGCENDILGQRFICATSKSGQKVYVNMQYVDLIEEEHKEYISGYDIMKED